MKNKREKHKKFCHQAYRFFFALIIILIITPSASFADLYPPTDTSCPDISLSVDASPAITYSWDLPFNEVIIEKFEMNVTVTGHIDDEYDIQYSPDDGGSWIDLDEPSFLAGGEIINNLQLRVNTDKVKKGDGAILKICDIMAELTEIENPGPPTVEEPTITQSAFGLYEDVDADDFYAITPSISGDTRAQAIAIDSAHMYVAGQVPLGTVRGWRIEKRNLADGVLVSRVEIPNGGEPNSIVLSGLNIFVVGDAHEDGHSSWHIEKLDFDLNRVTVFDIDNFFGTAYAAVIANGFLFIAGSDYTLGDAQWRVEKRDFEGNIEDYALNNPGNADDIPYAMVADDTSLYIGGCTKDEIGKNKKAITTVQFRIEKRSIDNLSQLSVALSDHDSETIDRVTALAIHGTDLYVAGVWEAGFWDTIGIIEKFNTDIFGTEEPEIIFEQDYGYDDRTMALAVGKNCWGDGSDCLIAAGFSSDIGSGGDAAWRVDVLNISSNQLEYSILLDINSHKNDHVYALAVDDTSPAPYMYLAGYQNPDIPKWHIQKRRVNDGSVGLPIDEIVTGDAFRYQTLLDVDTAPLAPNEADFLLQYGECEKLQGCNSCEDYAYSFVSDASPISFNSKGWDGMQALIGVPEYPIYDGTFMGYDIRYQTIVENGANFTNSTSINPGESGLWDFSLKANLSGTYCLRIVDSDYLPLGDYKDNQIIIP